MFPNSKAGLYQTSTRLADIGRPEGQCPLRGQSEQDFAYPDRYLGQSEARAESQEAPRANTRLADINRPPEYQQLRGQYDLDVPRPGRNRAYGEANGGSIDYGRIPSLEPFSNTHPLGMQTHGGLMHGFRAASDALNRRQEYGASQRPFQSPHLGAMYEIRSPLGVPSQHAHRFSPWLHQPITQPSFSSMAMGFNHLRLEDQRAEAAERVVREQDDQYRRLRAQREKRMREMERSEGTVFSSGREQLAARSSQQPNPRIQPQRSSFVNNSEGTFFRSGISTREQLQTARLHQQPNISRRRAHEDLRSGGLDFEDNIAMHYWEDDSSLTAEEMQDKVEIIRIQQQIMDMAGRGGRAGPAGRTASTAECAACMEGNPRSDMAHLSCGHAYCRDCFTSKFEIPPCL